MPIYEYRCSACGHELEALQKLSEPRLLTCPVCHADALVKKVSAAGFQLKGSGWYVTDFRNGNKGGGTTKPAAGDKPGDAKADAAGGDSKAAASASASGKADTAAPAAPAAKAESAPAASPSTPAAPSTSSSSSST
jgi:putative FmdB family regulatory protein